MKANHKGASIVGIEKERYGYEVELSNGIEMRFDKQGRFVRYDK
ncbi:MAG: PepSY-like domain-containing protein [Muribaculaceae bacterium]|nr:PepSY-like domain-containing protein [Muribaculaceae bacterium]